MLRGSLLSFLFCRRGMHVQSRATLSAGPPPSHLTFTPGHFTIDCGLRRAVAERSDKTTHLPRVGTIRSALLVLLVEGEKGKEGEGGGGGGMLHQEV